MPVATFRNGVVDIQVQLITPRTLLEGTGILPNGLFATEASYALEGWIHVQDGAVVVSDQDAFTSLVDGRAKSLALGLVALAVGDIDDECNKGWASLGH